MRKSIAIPFAILMALVVLGVVAGPQLIGAQSADDPATGDPTTGEALATAVAANSAAVQAFATAVAANDAAVQAFATAVATPEPTVAPTATPTAEEIEMATPANPPEHMVYAWWDWDYDNPNRNRDSALNEITVDIEIHNDIELTGGNGIYLMVCNGDVDGTGYYFGLQTDVHDPTTFQGRGKGLIFSRWETRDLENARIPDDGFTQSSGHEGDFIGVRRDYNWSDGEYRLRLAQDGDDDDAGRWYGVWITDLSTSAETWIGSLRFPSTMGRPAKISPRCYNTVEIYGAPITPADIPYFKGTMYLTSHF